MVQKAVVVPLASLDSQAVEARMASEVQRA